MKTISILGSTGSIGTQALEVCEEHNIKVKALAAHSNAKFLAEQVIKFDAEYACIFDENKLEELKSCLSGRKVTLLTGMEGLKTIASLDGVDIMLNSVVGMVGLVPTLTAIEHGTDIALANKETLVAGGKLVINAAKEKGVNIYPVDSEHSAIFQSTQGNSMNCVKGIILTASGGPFFGKTVDDLRDVTVEQALNHPNWSMGSKITIDSATLMNKGLEFIEAMWLFDLSPEQIEIVVHRESVIHSAVEFEDNSVIAQLGVPDMKIPIQYALLYPNRVHCDVKHLSLTDYGKLTFSKPDYETFKCLTACIKAVTAGGILPAAVNGANEQAVAAFLSGKISFLGIGALVEEVLETTQNREIHNVDDILEADRAAREYVAKRIIERQF
ncbi:MAG: 1-deoxy-D-xylulose-5-phosphate reductoisomerase [Ruminococcus sp.]|uniref:1-deoxy-D-xylulose-5-phosphate reductoisomerase n=1 Tax=Ruminococcus sp. TaxID=41978 RepID=UPI0025CD5395|nr:1-deoxy-D-xylulose-5-phosphate reductoisomerase [Ruminococcus sp.]MCR5541601.1 1-deoxy-D-xylulose-5-phosphate reductoisomerase [Ruminococcus sp.]